MDTKPYIVIGAGAVGGGIAGLMHRAGHDVTLVARGDNLTALRAAGLQLKVGHKEYRLRLPVVARLSEIDWSRLPVVLIAVKSQQTVSVLADLRLHLPAESALISLQNGVSNERTLLRVAEQVHGVSVMMPATHLRPGEVVLHSAGVPGVLDIGRYPQGADDVDRLVANDLTSAGFESVPRQDIMMWKYRKLLRNLVNAIDAAFANDADANALAILAQNEGERVLAAANILLTGVDQERARNGNLGPMVGRENGGSSTWQSMARGTGDVEVDYLNGEIVLLGRLHGVATPVNEELRRACLHLAQTGQPPRSLHAIDILRAIDAR